MNILKNTPLCLLCLLLFSNCDRQKDSDLPVIERYTDNKANLSDLFDEVTVVPLETDPNGLVGVGVGRIEVFEEKIFLLNITHSHQNILCFDSSGDFLFKIDKLGRGENEYTHLSDFFIDRDSREIVLDTEGGRFFRFDLSGQFIGETRTGDIYVNRQMCPLNDSVLVMLNDQSSLPEGIDLMTIDANTFDIKEQSPAQSALSGHLTPLLSISVYNDNALFYDATDSIFDVSDILDRKPKYVVDMGDAQRKSQETILKEIETNTYEGFLKRSGELFAARQLVLGKALFENDRYIFVAYGESSPESNAYNNSKYSFILYDKQEAKSYNSDNIVFDALNLPNMGSFDILGRSGETFYALCSPQWTDKERRRALENEKLSDKVKDYIREADNGENNPLLVILK